MDVGPDVAVNVHYSRSVLSNSVAEQLLYVLITLTCVKKSNKKEHTPKHVCIVIDRSTSMQGDRMFMVREGIINNLDALGANDRVSIVVFSDRAEIILPATSISKKDDVVRKLRMIDASGGTELYQGLSAGVTQLRGSKADNEIAKIVLLTDGHTYGDEENCLDLAREIAEEGIVIDALGIGHEWNDEFLDDLCNRSGGKTYFVDSFEDISKNLEIEFKSKPDFAHQVVFNYEPSAQVKVKSIFRQAPQIDEFTNYKTIYLGNLAYNDSLSLLFELEINDVPKDMERLHLIRGVLDMELAEKTGTREPIYFDLHLPVKTDPISEAVPGVILNAVSRLTPYKLQTKARIEVKKGNYNKAAEYLEYLTDLLLEQGENELYQTIREEIVHLKTTSKYSADGEKKVKYGTRTLLL